MYKYKLREEASGVEKFQQKRIQAFDELEARLLDIKKYLRQSKLATQKFYNTNPESFEVVYGTDLVGDYFNDIESLLKQDE